MPLIARRKIILASACSLASASTKRLSVKFGLAAQDVGLELLAQHGGEQRAHDRLVLPGGCRAVAERDDAGRLQLLAGVEQFVPCLGNLHAMLGEKLVL